MKPASAAAIFLAFGSAAAAQGDDARLSLDEFTVIAGGWQLERRCNHLGSTKHEELGRIVAHAEIDVAKRHGGERIKKVLAAADQFGEEKGANCGGQTVRAVKGAYNVAERWARATTVIADLAEEKRAAEKKRKADKKRKARRQAETERETASTGNRTLVRFGAQTRAYYLDLRCKHLPYRQALRFWKLIARKHRALTRTHGAGAVNRVSRQAKASAIARCGPTTRRLVQRGLSGIRQDVSQY
ncbi:MAG: hypothetical protein ACR2PM_13580 [Hyphomicrobiales bacterium]